MLFPQSLGLVGNEFVTPTLKGLVRLKHLVVRGRSRLLAAFLPIVAGPRRELRWLHGHIGREPVDVRRIPRRLKDAVPLRWQYPKASDSLDVKVIGLCPKGGEGVIRFKWFTHTVVEKEFLVRGALPGEVVTVTFGRVKQKKFPLGDFDVFVTPDVRKLQSSIWEVKSQCPHFEKCGGCDFLNLAYGRQLVEKQRWIEAVLREVGVSVEIVQRIRPSEPQTRFAHRTEWVFTEFDGDFSLEPFDPKVDERLANEQAESRAARELPIGCVLPPRVVVRVLENVFEAFCAARTASSAEAKADLLQSDSFPTSMAGYALPPALVHKTRRNAGRKRLGAYSIYDEILGVGTFRSIMVICSRPPRIAQSEAIEAAGNSVGLPGCPSTEVLLNIVVADVVKDPHLIFGPLVDAAKLAAGKRLVGVVVNIARSKGTVMGGRCELLLYGRRYARQRYRVAAPRSPSGYRDFVLHLGAGSRLPVHTRALPELARIVSQLSDLNETDIAWHCFCGGGELDLALSTICSHVVAIGTSAAEVSELKRNLAANDIENTTAVLANLRSPWTLKQLAFHITQSQQRRLLIGSGDEQAKAREYALTAFIPGENRRAQIQRLSSGPFNAPLLREDAMAHRELRTLLPAFVRDFRPSKTTLPVLVDNGSDKSNVAHREVPPEMEGRLKRLYRRLALRYHPDKNPDDPLASERFQALNRAYKALVGDAAGPQEGDEDVKDPFLVAMASSYRPKFKDRWRGGEAAKHRIGSGRPPQAHPSNSPVGEKGADSDPNPIDEEGDESDLDDEEDFGVKLEIDRAFASPRSRYPRPPAERFPDSFAHTQEIVLKEGGAGLARLGETDQEPSLPPPDVIVVSQPRARTKGRGTPRHFLSWLRSTAARAIVYVAIDVDAFQADVKRLTELGYKLRRVVPFDAEPHRRSFLIAARFDLVLPLVGLEDYGPAGETLLGGANSLLPGPNVHIPLLGKGGYSRSIQS